MQDILGDQGFRILRDHIDRSEIERLRNSADELAAREGAACVRRICERSEEFSDFVCGPKMTELLPADYVMVRSLLFDKTPDQNWPVLWHQDLTIAVQERVDVDGYGPWSVKDEVPHVQPPLSLLESMITARVHLDDADESNGALRVVPDSHLAGVIASDEVSKFTEKQERSCNCRTGDVLLMSPLLLHSSRRARDVRHRRVLHFEFAPRDGIDERLAWYEA